MFLPVIQRVLASSLPAHVPPALGSRFPDLGRATALPSTGAGLALSCQLLRESLDSPPPQNLSPHQGLRISVAPPNTGQRYKSTSTKAFQERGGKLLLLPWTWPHWGTGKRVQVVLGCPLGWEGGLWTFLDPKGSTHTQRLHWQRFTAWEKAGREAGEGTQQEKNPSPGQEPGHPQPAGHCFSPGSLKSFVRSKICVLRRWRNQNQPAGGEGRGIRDLGGLERSSRICYKI